jgi:uroporphyrinogen-III decarboxylase
MKKNILIKNKFSKGLDLSRRNKYENIPLSGKMTARSRLQAALDHKPVDRVPVNLYELGGFEIDPHDPDEFNVYKYPAWKPLLKLVYEQTDLIKMVSARNSRGHEVNGLDLDPDYDRKLVKTKTYIKNGSRFSEIVIDIAGRTLKSVSRRDPEVDTTWVLEHLLKDTDDLKAYLELPDDLFKISLDTDKLYEKEKELGERGIVMVETEDPICVAASLFSMQDFTIIAMTEQKLFHRLLEKVSIPLYKRTEIVARDFPGRLWRIFGPEYATEPYLPPDLFYEYAVKYTKPMVENIQKYNGLVRIHSHGKIKNVLDYIVTELNADAIDPVEAAPSGDITLKEVKEKYGSKVTIFGNIQISDIENMEHSRFKELVKRTIEDGLSITGTGFVLMPTSSPYGREISKTTLKNYEILVNTALDYHK